MDSAMNPQLALYGGSKSINKTSPTTPFTKAKKPSVIMRSAAVFNSAFQVAWSAAASSGSARIHADMWPCSLVVERSLVAEAIGHPVPGGEYLPGTCLLYTSEAADERSSVDLGG